MDLAWYYTTLLEAGCILLILSFIWPGSEPDDYDDFWLLKTIFRRLFVIGIFAVLPLPFLALGYMLEHWFVTILLIGISVFVYKNWFLIKGHLYKKV